MLSALPELKTSLPNNYLRSLGPSYGAQMDLKAVATEHKTACLLHRMSCLIHGQDYSRPDAVVFLKCEDLPDLTPVALPCLITCQSQS